MAARKSNRAVAVRAEPQRPEIAALGGGLEGAERTSRETMLWNADRRSPDQLINTVKVEADARGREVVTTDGYAQGVIDINRDNIVGTQYRLNAQPNFSVLTRMVSKSFDETWAQEYQEYIEEKFNLIAESNLCWLDAARQYTFTGMIRLTIAGFVYTGESLATAEWIRDSDRPFNTAIQMISPMRLSNPGSRADDALLRRGIAINQFGRPMGYYIRRAYPTEFYMNADAFTWDYVAATKPWGRKMVIHIKDPFEVGQSRGISALVAVLKDMRMTKKFNDVTLQNAVIQASYAATIESELPTEVVVAAMGGGSGNPQETHQQLIANYMMMMGEYASKSTALAVDGSKIPHLFPGTKLNAKALGTPGGVGTEFEVSLLRHIAAGLGISYEEFARDFSRTNYSSARASMLTTWKHMMARKKFIADKQADEIFGLWLEEDMNSAGDMPLPAGINTKVFYTNGALGIGFEALRQADWIGAGRGQIDELKETQAALLRIRGGLSTHEYEIAKQGGDWRKTFRQISREQQLLDKLGIVLDTNPTKDHSENTATLNGGNGGSDQQDTAETAQQNNAA